MKKILTWLLVASTLIVTACAPTPVAAPVYTIVPSESEAVKKEIPPEPAAAPDWYEVKKGDTLATIALRYDLDYREIARWNNLRNPNLIKPGQQLRLFASANDPVVATVVKQKVPTLQPLRPSADNSANTTSTPTTAAQSSGTIAAPTIERQSTVIGSDAAVSKAPAAGTAPYKSKPQAIKYAYSKKLLTTLQNDWDNTNAPRASTPPPPPPPKKVTAKASAPKVVAKPDSTKAGGKTRQRYGIVWGMPSTGAAINGYNSRSKGIDFTGNKGDPIHAAADGVVIYVGTGVKSYGRLIILRHEGGYLTAYAHNNTILVKENQEVARGSKIATMGDSGSEKVLLHFEVRKGGKPLDPKFVLPK